MEKKKQRMNSPLKRYTIRIAQFILIGIKNKNFGELESKEDKNLFWFEKPLVTFLFNSKRWNRPFRHIKNDRFENVVRNEMSQSFGFSDFTELRLLVKVNALTLTFLCQIRDFNY